MSDVCFLVVVVVFNVCVCMENITATFFKLILRLILFNKYNVCLDFFQLSNNLAYMVQFESVKVIYKLLRCILVSNYYASTIRSYYGLYYVR